MGQTQYTYVTPRHYMTRIRIDQVRAARGETSDTRKLMEIVRKIEFLIEETSLVRKPRGC